MVIRVEIDQCPCLEFPDDTPDEVIDRVVQETVAEKAPAGDLVVVEAIKELGLSTAIAAALQQRQHDERMDFERGSRKDLEVRDTSEEHAVNTAVKIDAINNASAGVRLVLSQVVKSLQPLQALGDTSQQIPDLVKAMNNLSATVVDVGKSIIDTLRMPSQVTYDDKDRPKSLGRLNRKAG